MHRDYHLGFQSPKTSAEYPAHVHALSPVLTLQGAVAHCDMPVETGPTLYLPHSQKYPHGYLAYWLPEFQEYFVANHVQLPLAKGDAVFFNPALFHAAGSNHTTDVRRMANLLQVSSAFGRAMETVDRRRVVEAVYPALLARKAAGMPPARARATSSPPPPRATPSRPTSTATSRSTACHPADPGRPRAPGARRGGLRRGAAANGSRRTSGARSATDRRMPAWAVLG